MNKIHAPDTARPSPAQAGTIVPRDEERQRCEIWTRVMGYHRPVSSFNRGKQGEFHERLSFSERRARLD